MGKDVKSKAIIWGTGRIANRIMKTILHYKKVLPEAIHSIIPDVFSFIDSNRTTEETFYGLPVLSPFDVDWKNSEVQYVVAVKDNKDIFNTIRRHVGVNYQDKVMTFEELIIKMHRGLVTEYSKKKYPIDDDILKKQICICSLIYRGDFEGNTKCGINDHDNFEKVLESNSKAEVLSALYFYNYTNTDNIINELASIRTKKSKKVKTIGMYCKVFSKGGAERVISNLFPLLRERGYDFVLITERRDENEYPCPDYVRRVNIDGDLQSNPTKYLKDYENIICENNIDVVCIHIPYYGLDFDYKVMLYKLMQMPIIAVTHNSIEVISSRIKNIKSLAGIYGLLNYQVTLSNSDEKIWKGLGVNSVCITNPVNMKADPEVSIRKKRKNLLWIGRISEPIKDVYSSINVIRYLKKRIPDIHLNIVGSVDSEKDLDALTAFISECDVIDNVTINGYFSDPSLFYKNADLMIMTSHGEGFPMTLLESKAYRLPTVMYDLPYLYFVEDGRGIITIPQGNYQKMASEVEKILSDTSEYIRFCEEAYQSYLDYIRIDIGEKWDKLFRSLEV